MNFKEIPIKIFVNKKTYSLSVRPDELLVDVLRKRLGLTGTKVGCNEGECGVCTVILNDKPILSCMYPAVKANGAEIITIEGLAGEVSSNGGKSQQALHPLQDAFIKTGAVQCGFCIPGQIMTAYSLLKENPSPSEDMIRDNLSETLCRCGSYTAIMRAVKAASENISEGKPIDFPPYQESTGSERFIGKMFIRPDAIEKVTGKAVFTDDLTFPEMLYGKVKRVGIPHGIVKRIDTSRAWGVPGVVAILTKEDIPGDPYHGLIVKDWPVLVGAEERVRYVGDAVAIVAAESEQSAYEAIDLIEVDVEPLPVLDTPQKALSSEAPSLHRGGNLLKHIKVRKGKVEVGFEDADIVLEHVFKTQTTDHLFLEPECSIARMLDDGKMEIYVGSQIPYADRSQIAATLNIQDDKVRVVGQQMGGGFGGKEDIAGQIHAALLAKYTHKPVKILYDRKESLLAHPKRHATEIRVRIGAKKDGRIVAIETELWGDTGAYASLGEKVMTRATTHSSGPYDIPHVKADCFAVYTNNPPAGAFRGFGVTQSAFAIESMIDILAEELGMDSIEIRRKNALRVGSVTCTGQILKESVGLHDCIDAVATELDNIAGGNPFASHKVPDAPHLRRAWGFAVAYKNTGLGGGAPDKATAELEAYPDGQFEVRISSAELGQGLVSVLQLIVAEELQVHPKFVRVWVMDTDLTPDGGPTTASRQTFVSGNAARYAARTMRQMLSSTLAEKFDVHPDRIKYIEGLACIDDMEIEIGKAVQMLIEEGRKPLVRYEYWAPETQPLGSGGDMHFAYSFAAQAAEVEVNTITGEVKVLQIIAANDVGKIINPLGLQVQVEGGIIMGIGNALTENYILENGIPYTDRMARYRIPSIKHTPLIKTITVEHATSEGPYGAKGIGEIVSIPTTPAITNAIYNAVGVRVYSLPVDQELIAKKINKALWNIDN